jgi:uncharacterized protein (DUF3820 family)
MDTKLTLNMDGEVTRKAKAYARSRGRSLSDLVEHYLRFLLRSEDPEDVVVSPRVKSLMGSLRIPDDTDYKKDLQDELQKKYSGK